MFYIVFAFKPLTRVTDSAWNAIVAILSNDKNDRRKRVQTRRRANLDSNLCRSQQTDPKSVDISPNAGHFKKLPFSVDFPRL